VALAWAGSSFNYLIQYRSMQMEQLKATVDTASIPLVLCADLNDTPASYGYRELRKSLHDDFQSCGKGYASTYLGIIGLMRIDYVMYDDNFKALRRKAIKLKNSDHRPVILDLKYLPDVF
jgi:endonuclease/exonuclease/phosphatase family metal-dependent hydrolase